MVFQIFCKIFSVKDGAIQVHRIVFAIDSGYVVNPDTCRAQAEGNVIFNLGQLYEANTVKDGRMVESNFNDFPLPRLPEMPEVVTILVPTGGIGAHPTYPPPCRHTTQAAAHSRPGTQHQPTFVTNAQRP